MSPARELVILVSRELRRNLRSVKGIILALLAVTGGTLVAIFNEQSLVGKHQMVRANGMTQDLVITNEMLRDGRELLYHEGFHYSEEMAKAVSHSPGTIDAVFRLCVWLTPILIAIVGFDAIAGDLQHRTVRYWSVRARRPSYIGAKFLGLLVSASIVTLAIQVIAWVVCIARGEAEFGAVVGWGIRYWLSSLPISAAWCALATLVGSIPRHVFLSLLFVAASFFAWWVFGLIGFFKRTSFFLYGAPNNYDFLLLSPNATTVLAGVAGLLAMTAALLTASAALFARRDL